MLEFLTKIFMNVVMLLSLDSKPVVDPASPSQLAVRLGRSERLMVGLGSQDIDEIRRQKLKPDIYDAYLVGAGNSESWTEWNSPRGAYIKVVTDAADSIHALPMFTLYQMATHGDGNLEVLNDRVFMKAYWDNAILLFKKLKTYGKPVLVNLEPDFWGYAQKKSSDPSKVSAHVKINSECTQMSDDIAGFGHCLVKMARQMAPNATIGFVFSDWAAPIPGRVISYMKQLGAEKADFVSVETSDRDIGCFLEGRHNDCQRGRNHRMWDDTNTNHPNFRDKFNIAQQYYEGLNRPILWWQTPMGAPPGSDFNTPWADNRLEYFLTHAEELTEIGSFGIVFSPGLKSQTSIMNDGGQFRKFSNDYLKKPAALK